jgi:hypothetical protein
MCRSDRHPSRARVVLYIKVIVLKVKKKMYKSMMDIFQEVQRFVSVKIIKSIPKKKPKAN